MPAFPLRSAVIALALAAFGAPALADPTPAAPAAVSAPVHMPPRMTAPEFHMGSPKAPVTMVEYASDTCSHCAKFDIEVFPAFKAKYVDTGKVQYILREFPTDPVQLSTAGFLLARCAGPDKYFDVVTTLFHSQTLGSGKDFVLAGAKTGGLSDAQIDACFNDAPALADFNARVKHAMDVDKVDGTPTFLINGKRMEDGEKTLKDLDAAIGPLLSSTKTKAVQKHRKA